MATNTAVVTSPWYRSLGRAQWGVLVASNLGWLFDGFELYALFLTVGFALHQLIDAAQFAAIPRYAGYILATTVFGWAAGGVIGGVISDYIGRKRTMILAVLAYSLTTGLSALAWDWVSFAVLRFLVGVGIGSEWATGASIVSELWPDHARGKGGGLLQCGAGLGGILASGVWLVIGTARASALRWVYLGGGVPGLLAFWVPRSLPGMQRGRRRRLHQPRLSLRRCRPQASRDAVLFHVSDPDAGGLSVGSQHPCAAVLGRRLRLLHPGDLGLGPDLAAGVVSDAHARHRGRVQL